MKSLKAQSVYILEQLFFIVCVAHYKINKLLYQGSAAAAALNPVYLMCTRLWSVSPPAVNHHVVHCFYTLILSCPAKG